LLFFSIILLLISKKVKYLLKKLKKI